MSATTPSANSYVTREYLDARLEPLATREHVEKTIHVQTKWIVGILIAVVIAAVAAARYIPTA